MRLFNIFQYCSLNILQSGGVKKMKSIYVNATIGSTLDCTETVVSSRYVTVVYNIPNRIDSMQM